MATTTAFEIFSLCILSKTFYAMLDLSLHSYLQDTVNFLLSILKSQRDRSQAFLAVGFLAIAVQGEIFTYISRIMDIIRASLPHKDLSSKQVAT